MRQKSILISTFAAALFVGAGLAHDDDRKALDKLPRYEGPGLRTGTPAVLGDAASAPMASGRGAPVQGLSPAGGMSAQGGGQINAQFEGKPFDQEGVQLLSWLTLYDLWDMNSGSSGWGYTSPSGREYALIGLSGGTGFVEITDPGNPVKVAMIPGPNSLWHDVRTYQNYAYAVSEGGSGIQVINLSQIDDGIVTLVNTVTTGGAPATHTVTINEATGYLYRAGGSSNGLRIYSLANPASPAYVGAWQQRYVHEATAVKYTSGPYAGKEIVFACGGLNGGFQDTGVDILDVTNKSNIQWLSHATYSGRAFCHQAWPSEDLKYLYINDELDEEGTTKTITKILDITDLSNPVEMPEFYGSKKSIGHNLYVKGDLIFEANYTSGLRVFDASDPLAPVESLFFDTWPEGSNASFNSLWQVYPYFQSGVVTGYDIEKGLFVWWVGDPLVSFNHPAGPPSLLSPEGGALQVEIAGDLVAGSAELHYDAGAGWVTLALGPVGGGVYEAQLPAFPCGDEIRYYTTARSSNGITWTDPQGAPGITHLATSAAVETLTVYHDFDTNPDWTKGDPSDDATFGIWSRKNPIANSLAQPGNDVSAVGTDCWLTGNSLIGLSILENNVDGGKTTLYSAVYDLSTYAEPMIGYWRWYSNHISQQGQVPFEDIFEVEITSDGTSWIDVETVGPAGPEVVGGWIHHQFRVADFVTPNATVQMRFIVSDYNSPSLVEAAIDDFEIHEVGCQGAVSYCTAGISAGGCSALLSATGTASASASSGFTLTAGGVEGQKDGLFFFGTNGRQANSWGSSTSFQCVAPPVMRTPLLSGGGTLGACDSSPARDLNAYWCATCPGPLKNPGAGALVQAQFWYRDPLSTSNQTTAHSDAIEFSVQP
jgi:choice-of-anchor B domain-containing protein